MKPTDSRFNDGLQDETLLTEGNYHGWFWKGLSDQARSYLAQEHARTYSTTRVCGTCEVRKPLGAFNIGSLPAAGVGRTRCNKCSLKNEAHAKSRRWEDTSPVGWQDKAGCDQANLSVFFPEEGQGRNWYLAPDAEWREYCPECPVKRLCEDYARQSKSEGVFGGKFFYKKSNEQIMIDEHAPKMGRPKKTT